MKDTRTLSAWLWYGDWYVVWQSPIVIKCFSKSTIEREVEYLKNLSFWTKIEFLLKIRR